MGRLVIPAALALAALYWAVRDLHPLGSFNDDAGYYLNALAWRNHQPVPTSYLPGESAILYLGMLLFGPNPGLLRILGIPMTLATGALIYLALKTETTERNRRAITAIYLLSSVVAIHATNLMSEIPFGLLVWASLALLVRRKSPFGAGLLLSLALCTRPTAWFVVGGVSVALAVEKRFREIPPLLLGYALPYGALRVLGLIKFPNYIGQLSEVAPRTYNASYLWNWMVDFLNVCGTGIFVHPVYVQGPVPAVLALVLLLAAAVGLRKHRFLALCMLGYLGGHLVWPYQFSRYWMLPLPVVLLGWLELTRGNRWVIAGLLALCLVGDYQAIQLAHLRTEHEKGRWELYAWLGRQEPKTTPVMAVQGTVAELLSGHPGRHMPTTQTVAELTGFAASERVGYLLWLFEGAGLNDVNGNPYVQTIPGIEQRLESSGCWKKVYSTEYGSVFQLTVDPERFWQGLLDLRAAEREGLPAVKRCLEKLPDLPEARFQQAQLEEGHLDSLRVFLAEHPGYPEYETWLADAYLARGRHKEAHAVAAHALPEAERQGLGAAASRLQVILKESGKPPSP